MTVLDLPLLLGAIVEYIGSLVDLFYYGEMP